MSVLGVINSKNEVINLKSEYGKLPVRIGAERVAGVLHREAVTAIDKLAVITITAAKNDIVSGSLTAVERNIAVSPGNEYGPVGPSAIVKVTPTEGKSIDIAIPQCAGATYYDIFLSTDAAPKWVARITEAQRAAGCRITAVGTVGATYAVCQVETATIVGTITKAGTCDVTFTSALLSSPLVVHPALALGDEAADVAQKIVDYIALMEICNDYTFAVAGANIVMTAKAAAANDSTLNIAYDNGTCEGLTSDADSADTTAGVAPKVNVQVDGDGVATTADPFKANNAYTPDEVYALDCKGASKAKVYVDVYVTDFRSAPALSFIPFYKKQDADEYAQGILQAVTLLTASGKSLRQVFDLDVDGADGLVLLVDAISGQDASVNFYVELVA